MIVFKCYNRACPYQNADRPDGCTHPFVQRRECPDAIMSESDSAKPKSFYLTELQSNECYCGSPKKRGFSFCYGCYKSLPGDMQRSLYKRIGHGYEAAYESAVKWLDENIL